MKLRNDAVERATAALARIDAAQFRTLSVDARTVYVIGLLIADDDRAVPKHRLDQACADDRIRQIAYSMAVAV